MPTRTGRAGGFVRSFVEVGPELARVFQRLDPEELGRGYVGVIQRAFRKEAAAMVAAQGGRAVSVELGTVGGEKLSRRELEVLALLGRRLRNAEIADELCISEGTVKRHAATIYQKLHVHGRGEAVDRARQLGLLEQS